MTANNKSNNDSKKRRQENSIKNPGAAVIIYNYKYRLGTEGLSEDQAHEIDQVILNTVSLRKVSTSKSKAQPAGKFEILLAPTKNWVNSITPGSWCVILMSQEKIVSKDTKWNNPTADFKKVKMLGRIESVRAVSSVNQDTGAITTEYIVQGEDWGGILNTLLYVDTILRSDADSKDPVGTSNRYVYNNKLIGFGTDAVLPTASENIEALLSFWGATNEARTHLKKAVKTVNRLGESKNQFRVPKEIVKFFDFQDDLGMPAGSFADILNIISGTLNFKDPGPTSDEGKSGLVYQESNDGASPMMFSTLLGTHDFWQLIINNSNHWINDTYAEMRWEKQFSDSDPKPLLTIYNRIKPFALNSSESIKKEAESRGDAPQMIDSLTSQFKHIRTHNVDRADLILVNAGTNWRDRYNFIEVNATAGSLVGASDNGHYDGTRKLMNQTFDEVAMGRDGFKPKIINAVYLPHNEHKNEFDLFRLQDYKTMSREWFFNIHRMLNGSMTLVGQSEYVAVGDNIMIDADAIFPGKNANADHITNKDRTFFLAHIESVSHTCTVNNLGARSFITEIQFVRGIITDINGDEIKDDVLLDANTSDVTPTQELNSNRAFGTSSGKDGKADPDIQKLKGN